MKRPKLALFSHDQSMPEVWENFAFICDSVNELMQSRLEVAKGFVKFLLVSDCIVCLFVTCPHDVWKFMLVCQCEMASLLPCRIWHTYHSITEGNAKFWNYLVCGLISPCTFFSITCLCNLSFRWRCLCLVIKVFQERYAKVRAGLKGQAIPGFAVWSKVMIQIHLSCGPVKIRVRNDLQQPMLDERGN